MDEDDNVVLQASPAVEYHREVVILRVWLKQNYNAVVKLPINEVFVSARVFGTRWWRPHVRMPGDMTPPTGREEDEYLVPARFQRGLF